MNESLNESVGTWCELATELYSAHSLFWKMCYVIVQSGLFYEHGEMASGNANQIQTQSND